MRRIQLIAIIGLILIFSSCGKDLNSLSVINSESFPEKQINLHFQPNQQSGGDSLVNTNQSSLSNDQQLVLEQIDEMILRTDQIRKSESDSAWNTLVRKWSEFNTNIFGADKTPFETINSLSDSWNNKVFPEAIRKWAELNVDLVKLSEDVKFGDALERMVYSPNHVFISEKLIKSVVYTHCFDQVFVNIIGSSSMDYTHTTGGNVRIIQETNYPEGNEMVLKSECNDLRYMDLFIRIPSWAVNPTVTHGNVKYVALPGEYCQISRKWKTGDEIRVILKN
jgi:hypothetical protein